MKKNSGIGILIAIVSLAALTSFFTIYTKPKAGQQENLTSANIPAKSVDKPISATETNTQNPELSIGAVMPMQEAMYQATDGRTLKFADVKGEKGTVIVFWCNTCPWVARYESRMIDIAKAYKDKGFGFLALNPNDAIAYPDESFEKMKELATSKNYPFAYAADTSSKAASAFGAARTPHVYVFDKDNKVVYVGGIDSNPQDAATAKPFLKNALEAIISGQPNPDNKTRAFGCTIKWQTEG